MLTTLSGWPLKRRLSTEPPRALSRLMRTLDPEGAQLLLRPFTAFYGQDLPGRQQRRNAAYHFALISASRLAVKRHCSAYRQIPIRPQRCPRIFFFSRTSNHQIPTADDATRELWRSTRFKTKRAGRAVVPQFTSWIEPLDKGSFFSGRTAKHIRFFPILSTTHHVRHDFALPHGRDSLARQL